MDGLRSEPALGPEDLRRLLDVGRDLVAVHEPEAVLDRLLEAARELTSATYAAIGVLDETKRELERFVFVGVDEELRRRIGSLPRGHGILGELIRHPEPLRLSRIGDHPRSYGFPAGHPTMETFLGAPVMIRGEVYGNLYLTEKRGGEPFDERDEELVVVLARWAAIAIDNARQHSTSERRRRELERAVRGLEATAALSVDLGGEGDIGRVLELVVKRARDLVDARSCVVLLLDENDLRPAGAAGELRIEEVGELPEAALLDDLAPARRLDASEIAAILGGAAAPGILAPLRSRGRAVGSLLAIEHLGEDAAFSADDVLALASFATSAATAIAAAQAAEDDRMRAAIGASERERQRWARELHDETLQDLGALRVLQESALQADDGEAARRALEASGRQIDGLIEGLRGLITELRPAALDQLGIAAAVEALIERVSSRSDLDVDVAIDLDEGPEGAPRRFDPELESTVYRLIQESLTNVVKHAGASRATVSVREDGEALVVTIEDDGRGLAESPGPGGFGLLGMRERVQLAAGELRLGSGPRGGTRVWACLPVPEPGG